MSLDAVFPPESSQQEVYAQVGLPLISDVLLGYNATIFTYGQTGTGKTYSMLGTDIYDSELRGIIPRAVSDLFSHISSCNAEFTLKCSMLEIYKERLCDLLSEDSSPLQIKEDPRRGIFVSGLKQVCVASEEEIMQVVSLGGQMRTVAATRLNSVSSRSHQIFILEVRQRCLDDSEKLGLLNLVDLAGSERVSYFGVTGNNLQETKKINLSLSALGNVIHALTSNSDHIPYRDSKLTRLLQESLGGNYKTSILVSLSPSYRFLDETVNSLKFAQRAKTIRNSAKINIKESADTYLATITRLEQQLAAAHREIHSLQHSCKTPASDSKVRHTSSMTDSTRKTAGKEQSILFDSYVESCSCYSTREIAGNESPMPSFSLSNTRFGTDTTISNEISAISACFEEKIREKDRIISELKAELRISNSQNEDLKTDLTALKGKIVKFDLSAHEKLQEIEKLRLIVKNQSEEIEHLKVKNESDCKNIINLEKIIVELEAKCWEMMEISKISDPTKLEFSDFREILEENSEKSDFQSIKMPFSAISPSNYTEKIASALENNSILSQTTSLFTLQCALQHAALLNSSLSSLISSQVWKAETWRRKYDLAKHRYTYQQNSIKGLESLVDTLYEAFYRLKNRVERWENEKKPTLAQGNVPIIVKPVRKYRFHISETVDPCNRRKSFATFSDPPSVSHDMSELHQTYILQLTQKLEESKSELTAYLKLQKKTDSEREQRENREKEEWKVSVLRMKETYERELCRKQQEIVGLQRTVARLAELVPFYAGKERSSEPVEAQVGDSPPDMDFL